MVSPDGLLARDQLVEDEPHREEVAAAVDVARLHLLGETCSAGSHHEAGGGGTAHETRHPEVHDLRGRFGAGRCSGLHVACTIPVLVGMAEAARA
jgi:hypothetical protein